MVPAHLTDLDISALPAIETVVIGASAGAIEALGVLLPPLPAKTALAVIVVVHLPARHPSLLVDLFRPQCQMAVHEALDKSPVAGGAIYFAPPDYHLLVESERTFALSVDEPVLHSRPSIDVLFESAARVYGDRLLAIVLTGASHDGAAGAAAVRAAGGKVVVQDPATAQAPTLPRSTLERLTPDGVGPLADIAALLQSVAQRRIPS